MKIQQQIEQKLAAFFMPHHLDVLNESHQHNVPPNSETHFRVLIVSDSFEGQRAVKRQQAVYGVLSEELAGEVHALTMQTLTSSEWSDNGQIAESPPCLGGEK